MIDEVTEPYLRTLGTTSGKRTMRARHCIGVLCQVQLYQPVTDHQSALIVPS